MNLEIDKNSTISQSVFDDLTTVGAGVILEGLDGNSVTFEQFREEIEKIVGNKYAMEMNAIYSASIRKVDTAVRREEIKETVENLRSSNPSTPEIDLTLMAVEIVDERKAELVRRKQDLAEAYAERDRIQAELVELMKKASGDQ